MSTYIYLIIWWVVFFALHSIMASSTLKNKINLLNPVFKSYYRLVFNIVSTFLLIPIVYVYYRLPTEYLFTPTLLYQLVGVLLSIAGIYIVFDGFKNYRTDEFLGTFQIKNQHDFHPAKLSRDGWNGVVRHPLYFGGIILVFGLILITPTVKLGITNLLVIGYLYIGTLWEEEKLKSEFGSTYDDYKREVSMLMPVKWIIAKFRRR
jgi:protein-S-isoprenylcysteine O-methyltransferase Ste14